MLFYNVFILLSTSPLLKMAAWAEKARELIDLRMLCMRKISHMEQIEKHRKRIDRLNEALVKVLGQRYKLVKKIIAIKKRSGMPISDFEREEKIRQNLKQLAKQYELPEEMVLEIFEVILKEKKLV